MKFIKASKILKLMYEFTEMQQDNEPLFLFLEIPSNKRNSKISKNLIKKENIKLKMVSIMIYYLDGISKKFFKNC